MKVVPRVSVVLPVYNCAQFVGEAIESILRQEFRDYEIVVVDDGSTDDSPSVIQRYAAQDTRIRVISRPNTGLVGALNDGVTAARGSYIARMDADDLSLPDRLGRQVDYLDSHATTVAVGCRAMFADPDGAPLRTLDVPLTHTDIEALLLRGGQAMIGAATMLRRTSILQVGAYRPSCDTLEDLDLHLRLGEVGELANLPDVLYIYRQHMASICRTRSDRQRRIVESVVAEARERRGLRPPGEELLRREADLSPVREQLKWAWWALSAGYVETARKHAFAVLRKAPLSVKSWRVAYCAWRGR